MLNRKPPLSKVTTAAVAGRVWSTKHISFTAIGRVGSSVSTATERVAARTAAVVTARYQPEDTANSRDAGRNATLTGVVRTRDTKRLNSECRPGRLVGSSLGKGHFLALFLSTMSGRRTGSGLLEH